MLLRHWLLSLKQIQRAKIIFNHDDEDKNFDQDDDGYNYQEPNHVSYLFVNGVIWKLLSNKFYVSTCYLFLFLNYTFWLLYSSI